MDVFSLGVSILYLANAEKMAEISSSDRWKINEAIIRAIEDGKPLDKLEGMLRFDPDRRDSAQQFMLKMVPGDTEALSLPPQVLGP